MTLDRAAARLQFLYPRIYFACHTRHGRRRSGAGGLSDRDVQILVHLDAETPMTLGRLARHLGVATSTLSEAVTGLAALGYVDKRRDAAGDRRPVALAITAQGVSAVRAASVLETARVRRMLRRIPAPDRASIIEALQRLADASRPRAARTGRRGGA